MALKTTIAVSVWMGCVVASMGALQKYANTPGEAEPAPRILTLEHVYGSRVFPIDNRIPRVYLFLHEHCPCSRASVEELARHRDLRDNALIIAVLSGPASMVESRQSIRQLVKERLPLAMIREDPSGETALQFGALTSGYTALYRGDGTLYFSGGITPSRSHAGPCPGRTALATLIDTRRGKATSAPVFGCPLFSDSCDDAEYCGVPTP